MSSKSLEGLKIVSFESRHAQTIADLVKLQGGVTIQAPSMKEVPIEENRQVFSFAERLFAGEVDVLILLTGVGTRALLSVLETKYTREQVLETLRKTTIVPRGPKPIRVLMEWNVPYALTVPEPNTWKELLDTLDQHQQKVPLKNRKVFVQEYGVSNDNLTNGLQSRGAMVTLVPVYRWALPDNLEPLKQAIRMIAEEKADILVFTTAVQIEHVLKVAESMGLEQAFRMGLKKMAIASVGPDCSEALRAKHFSIDIEPDSPKMGPLVLKVAAEAPQILKVKRG